MSERPADFRLSTTQDADIVQYHALSGLAVAGLLLGLFSVFALLAPMLWLLPELGAIVSGAALWRIHRSAPALAGRRLAQCGLLLSIALGVAVPVDGFVYHRLIRNEGRDFAALWFEHLRQGDAQQAHQLALHPAQRQPRGADLRDFYEHNARAGQSLERYLKTPLVQTLLAQGPKANVRYDRTQHQETNELGEEVDLIYAISYAQPAGQTTLSAELDVERYKLESGQVDWQVVRAEIVGPAGP
jgi:hypothetical protein